MYKIILITTLMFLFTMLGSQNPSSTNYILQQSSFGSGSDPANPPTSANYILKGNTIGVISGEEASSTNHNILPGYYLGEISVEILPPEDVTVSVVGTNIQLNWSAVTGATSYKVYSSEDPYSGFGEDTTGTFTGESWSTPVPNGKKFYYVKAVN